jgi:hypothetical protein
VRGPDAAPGVRTLFRFRGDDPECVFEVSPGVAVGSITVELRGVNGLSLGADGSLRAQSAGGVLTQSAPRAFEETPQGPREVTARYTLLAGGRFGFEVAREDPAVPLIIDPVLTFSTPLGGEGGAYATSAAFGPDGTLWIVGSAAQDFPGPPGTSIGTEPGGAAVVRFDPVARQVLSTTWIGGTGWTEDEAHSVALDAQGRAFVAGVTESPDFPALGGPQTAFGGNRDAFLVRLSPDGSRLDWGTFLGGSGFEAGTYPFGRVSLAVTSEGDAVIAGTTESADFPTKAAFQGTMGGTRDGFVARLRGDGSEVVFASYIGGADLDATGDAVAVAPDGDILVTGYTRSPDFPGTELFGGPRTGDFEGYVADLAPMGQEIRRAILLGPNSVSGLAYEPGGTLLLLGRTADPAFPLPPAPHGPPDPGTDVYLLRLDGGMGSILAGTLFGGSGREQRASVAVAGDGTIWISGSTSSEDLPLVGPFQPLLGSSPDAFLAALDPGDLRLRFSTYLGGNGVELGNALAIAPDGATWLLGGTSSSDFPGVDPLQDLKSGDDRYSMFLARFTLAGTGTPPLEPEGLAAEPRGGNEIHLLWQDRSEDESGFAVYRKEEKGNSRIASVPAGTTEYSDGTVLPARHYTYSVQAFNDAGGSAASPGADAWTPDTLAVSVDFARTKGFNEWTQTYLSEIRGTILPVGSTGEIPLDLRAGGVEFRFDPTDLFDTRPFAIRPDDPRWKVTRHGRRLRWGERWSYQFVFRPHSGKFRLKGYWASYQSPSLKVTTGNDAGAADLEWDGWFRFVPLSALHDRDIAPRVWPTP